MLALVQGIHRLPPLEIKRVHEHYTKKAFVNPLIMFKRLVFRQENLAICQLFITSDQAYAFCRQMSDTTVVYKTCEL